MKELSQLNIVSILHYWWISVEMRRWYYKFVYVFIACSCDDMSFLYWYHFDLSFWILVISQHMHIFETCPLYPWNLNFVSTYLLFLFNFLSNLTAVQDFFAIFRNMFLILSVLQLPGNSSLATILIDNLYHLPLLFNFSFAPYHSVIVQSLPSKSHELVYVDLHGVL
jgi:hypothetical protein